MRWLTLYAHSRQVPASLATVLISAAAGWALTRDGSAAPGGSQLPAVVLTAGAMALSTGLGGQDLDLDRSAAIRWAPRRAAHVLLGGAIVGAVLLTVQMVGQDLATTEFVAPGLRGTGGAGRPGCGGRGRTVRLGVPLHLARVRVPRSAPGDHGAREGGDLDAAAGRHACGDLDGTVPRGGRHGALRPRGTGSPHTAAPASMARSERLCGTR